MARHKRGDWVFVNDHTNVVETKGFKKRSTLHMDLASVLYPATMATPNWSMMCTGQPMNLYTWIQKNHASEIFEDMVEKKKKQKNKNRVQWSHIARKWKHRGTQQLLCTEHNPLQYQRGGKRNTLLEIGLSLVLWEKVNVQHRFSFVYYYYYVGYA